MCWTAGLIAGSISAGWYGSWLMEQPCAGREKRTWEVYSAQLGRKGGISKLIRPLDDRERQDQLAKRMTQAAADPEAQAELVMELHGHLMNAERMIASLQGSTRMAQKTRDASKSSMVHENMDLLKVSSLAPCFAAAYCHCA